MSKDIILELPKPIEAIESPLSEKGKEIVKINNPDDKEVDNK